MTYKGEFLRLTTEQHKIKNIVSKNDDAHAELATEASRLILDNWMTGNPVNKNIILSGNEKAIYLAQEMKGLWEASIHAHLLLNIRSLKIGDPLYESKAIRQVYDPKTDSFSFKPIETVGGIAYFKENATYAKVSKAIYLADVAKVLMANGVD